MNNLSGLGEIPLYDAVRRYREKDLARFHTPGHKGAASSPAAAFMGEALSWDLTELPETDSLFDAVGPLLRAEELAAKEAGAFSTLFSAGGATLCLQTMLALVLSHAEKGAKKIVCARNAHRSIVNTMVLLGLEPLWVWPRPFASSPLPGAIIPEDVESLLAENPDAAAVLITSPDYYGVLSDITGIAEVCHHHGVPLLVDNAHGGHLLYCGSTLHPLRQGADLVCDSAHKTLPVLTGGALLHVNSPAYSRAEAKSAMALFGSSSPSYLTLLSLDTARAWLAVHGNEAFGKLCSTVAELRVLAAKAGFFTPERAVFDPARITLDFSSVGLGGREAESSLRSAGISPELCGPQLTVLIPSPFNAKSDFECLASFLKNFKGGKTKPVSFAVPEKLRTVMTPRQAALAPCETVEILQSAGRVAAESRCPCPPGVPLVMPGEAITKTLAKSLKNVGVSQIKVVK